MDSGIRNNEDGSKKASKKKSGSPADSPRETEENPSDTMTQEESPLSDDDIPPFLRNLRNQESSRREPFTNTHQSASDDPDDLLWRKHFSRQAHDTTQTEKRESFWDKFKPSLMGSRKRGSGVRKNIGADSAFFTNAIFLVLILLLAFTVLQQVSSGGIRWMTATALLFTVPYIIMLIADDLRAYWSLEDEQSRGFRSRINKLLGPGILSVAVSSCIFSAPLEGRVWIVGKETTGTRDTLVRIPVFKKITSIPQYQGVVMDVSGKTSDGVIAHARISVPIICCDDAQADTIVSTYGTPKAKPEILIQHYLNEIFDNAFKQAVAGVKAVDVSSAYASMAKIISKKQIRQTSALFWRGTFMVTNSWTNPPRK